MTIIGLENNNYLAGNDIWLTINGYDKLVQQLEIVCTNTLTNISLKKITLYPDPQNSFSFNISGPIRALFPEPSLTSNNSLQVFDIEFTTIFVNPLEDPVSQTLTRSFIRGHKSNRKSGNWYLENNSLLIIEPWLNWPEISETLFAQRLIGETIIEVMPYQVSHQRLRVCNYKLVKFLNSLGGWQYYVFDAWEEKIKSNDMGEVQRSSYELNQHPFRNVGNEYNNAIEFQTKTSYEAQNVIMDLIKSSEVYLRENGFWVRLKLTSNSAIKNSSKFSYDNKLGYEFVDNVKVWL